MRLLFASLLLTSSGCTSSLACEYTFQAPDRGRSTPAELTIGQVIAFFLLLPATLPLDILSMPVQFILWLNTGPTREDTYPLRETSPYVLPWPPGRQHYCVQGNRGIVSHKDSERYAYDFAMPIGSTVCAARAGVVIGVTDHHDGNGLSKPNNGIAIRHEDGTIARYLHLMKGGRLVRRGDRVVQGQPIGYSGHVGISMLPHLHFEVERKGETIPVSFADVPEDGGVPRMFKFYRSKR